MFLKNWSEERVIMKEAKSKFMSFGGEPGAICDIKVQSELIEAHAFKCFG